MSSTKKRGYNWKARLQKCDAKVSSGGSSIYVELDQSCSSCHEADTNAQVLLPVKQKLSEKDDIHDVNGLKRKKLSVKQRKHLLKVVEAKERKAKHAAILDNLASLSLPDSQLALLQSSVQLGKYKRTCKQVVTDAELYCKLKSHNKSKCNEGNEVIGNYGDQLIAGDTSHLVGTMWRKKCRKRRPLKIEKVLYDPKPKLSTVNKSLKSDISSDSGSSETEDAVVQDNDDIDDKFGLELDSVEIMEQNTTKCKLEGDDEASHPSPGKPKEPTTKRDPAKYVQLSRDPAIQCSRLCLPILSEEQVIMEAITDHSVVVLCGETGSGKTTQVPQFLYEAGYTLKGKGQEGNGKSLIGVTEPRRVAAVSMARRVRDEMGVKEGVVAYQIRYERTTTDDMEIKFMTDGVLLKEVEKDFLLSQYSVVVIDEAHERGIFTDILIGLLSRIVPLREKNGNPLKMVIMSATLRVEDFTENKLLFPSPPPVIRIESRQYPVTVHFNRHTHEDYMGEAFRKVCKIHRTLQPGNILVFVTGQREVHLLCRQLSRTFPRGVNSERSDGGRCGRGMGSDGRKRRGSEWSVDGDDDMDQMKVRDGENCDEIKSTSLLETTPFHDEDLEESHGSDDEGDMYMEEDLSVSSELPMKVLPLYSLLSPAAQAKVFQPPPVGVRLCVVATNVAETSLTIPDVKYVVDTGKVKRRYYDKVTGVSTFRICWTSKASANQRSGRAGRTEPGHCYRLFSSALFHNEFEEFSPPEITRRPVEDLVLQMKAMHIDRVSNFPFPTPPSSLALTAAEKLLQKLGALESTGTSSPPTSSKPLASPITPLGITMAQFPVAPRYAKMLCLGKQYSCLPFVIALVSALSVKELFVEGDESGAKGGERWTKLRRSWVGKGESLLLGDLMVLLRLVGACEYAGCSESFCLKNGIRRKVMFEVRKLRQQLTNIVNTICPEETVVMDPKMSPLSEKQTKYMRQIVLSGLGDHVAQKISTHGMDVEDKKRLRYAYQSTLCVDPVYIHPSSILLYENPEYVVFQEITETSKLYMRGLCAVEASWLPCIQPEFCVFSTPLEDPPPFFDDDTGTVNCHVTCTYGECNWAIGVHKIPYPNTLMKYKLFAMFLLQGKVIAGLSKFSPFLLLSPISLIRNWSKLHQRCEVLVAALANKEVCSREKLLEVWQVDTQYLLKAYSMWLPESRHGELASGWPVTN